MSGTEPVPTDSKSIAQNPVAVPAAESKFPLAEIQEAKATSAIIFQSRMWWLTLVCFVTTQTASVIIGTTPPGAVGPAVLRVAHPNGCQVTGTFTYL